VTGLAASVTFSSTTTTGSSTETGTASSGSSRAGRGDVSLLSTGVTRLSLGGRALIISLRPKQRVKKLTSRDK
jgi:hypothetical protein